MKKRSLIAIVAVAFALSLSAASTSFADSKKAFNELLQESPTGKVPEVKPVAPAAQAPSAVAPAKAIAPGKDLSPNGSPSTVTVGDRTFQISPPQGHRGAERLIIGGGEILYYSPDHYTTFIQLQVIR